MGVRQTRLLTDGSFQQALSLGKRRLLLVTNGQFYASLQA